MGLLFNDFNYFNVLFNSLVFKIIIPECHKVTKLLAIGFRLRNNSPVISKSTWRVPFSSTTSCLFIQDSIFGILYWVLIPRSQSKKSCNDISVCIRASITHGTFLWLWNLISQRCAMNSNSPDWCPPLYKILLSSNSFRIFLFTLNSILQMCLVYR